MMRKAKALLQADNTLRRGIRNLTACTKRA